MKCLTVCQPWAWAIIHGPKRIENRTWPTSYRGPLLIHAGKSLAWLKKRSRRLNDGSEHPPVDELVFGAILGTVDLVDCVRMGQGDLFKGQTKDQFAEGPWCWILENPCAFEPVYCPGEQGLWVPKCLDKIPPFSPSRK